MFEISPLYTSLSGYEIVLQGDLFGLVIFINASSNSSISLRMSTENIKIQVHVLQYRCHSIAIVIVIKLH